MLEYWHILIVGNLSSDPKFQFLKQSNIYLFMGHIQKLFYIKTKGNSLVTCAYKNNLYFYNIKMHIL